MRGQLNHLVPATSLVSRVRRRSRQLTQNKMEDFTGDPRLSMSRWNLNFINLWNL